MNKINSLWELATESWNIKKVGEEITSNIFSTELVKGPPSKNIKNRSGWFLNYLVKSDRAKKFVKNGETVYVKVKNFEKGGVEKTRILLNELDDNESFTLKKFMEWFENRFKEKVTESTIFYQLVSACELGYLKRERIEKPGSGANPYLYTKVLQIPKDHKLTITRKQYRSKPTDKTLKIFDKIDKFMKENNYELTKRLPPGAIQELSKTLDISIGYTKALIVDLKKYIGIKVQEKSPKIELTTDLSERCINKGLTRDNPNAEKEACEMIIDASIYKLPKGGASMIIGTPTSFCASTNSNNNLFLVDNLIVATTLNATSDKSPIIVIGNLIDPVKAELKAKDWRSNNMTNNFEIIVAPVDQISFTRYVTQLVVQNNFGLTKVILMGSGVWSFCKDSQKKYAPHNFNFEDPCIRLTNSFKNLHILAMVSANAGNGFGIRYLHDGKNELLE